MSDTAQAARPTRTAEPIDVPKWAALLTVALLLVDPVLRSVV